MRHFQRRSSWFVLVALVATLLSSMVPAGAQESAGVEVLRVDLRDDQARVAFQPAEGTTGDVVVVEAGGTTIEGVDVLPLRRSSVDAFTVLVVDDSSTADQVVGFSQIQQAALAYLDSLGSDTRVMLVRGGGGNPEVRPVVPFTADHRQVREAIEAMSPGGGSVTWNAIARSANVFDSQGDGLRRVVAIVASSGSASTIPSAVANGTLLTAEASLSVVLPQAPNLDVTELRDVALGQRGGDVYDVRSGESMANAASRAAAVHESTLLASFSKAAIPGDAFTLTVDYGGSSDRVRFSAGALSSGAALIPPALIESSRFDVLSGDTGALVAIGLGVLAALMFTFSMLWIFAGNDDSLNDTLRVYGVDQASDEQLAADEAFSSVRSRIVEQVVERAEQSAANRGKMQITQAMLERAEIPLRVGEAIAVQIGIVFATFALGFLVFRNVFVALLITLAAGMLPMAFLKMKVGRRKKKLESQLPDTLVLLASTLKAGYSFLQGIDAVGNEAEEPLAGEFRRTVSETRLGKEVDEALDDLAERVESVDLLWAVIAIKIQREVGGNLAELLTTVADTMTQRTRLKGEVSALTAEGRISALVLIVLPFMVGAAMYFMNRDYIATLWTSGALGFMALAAAGVGMIVGSLWMRKIIDIKI